MCEMRFSREEFDIMLEELVYSDKKSFDMLAVIVEKVLRKKVEKWCRDDVCLRGREFDKDIMQNIHMRLIKTVIPYFLLKDGPLGKVNDDPEGFEDWLYKVGENVKRSFANKVRSSDFKTDPMNDRVSVKPYDEQYWDELARKEELNGAFRIVLSSDMSIYKVITWVGLFVLVLGLDMTKIKATNQMVKYFEHKTLNELYSTILNVSKSIPWLKVKEKDNIKILLALKKPCKGNTTYGEMEYGEFYMMNNGKKDGKKSISDWVNRINDVVRKKYRNFDLS